MSTSTRELGVKQEVSQLAARVREVIGSDSVRNFAHRAGVKPSTLQSVFKGTKPTVDNLVAIAKAGQVTVDWLATGEGPVHFEAGKSDDDGKLKAQIQGIQAALENEECPIHPEKLRERPDLDNIHQQLLLIARDSTISDSHRAAADMILDLAFGDRAAAGRREGHFQRGMDHLRRATETLTEAEAEIGFQLGRRVAMHLRDIIYMHDIPKEDVVLLIDAMKSEFSPERKAD